MPKRTLIKTRFLLMQKRKNSAILFLTQTLSPLCDRHRMLLAYSAVLVIFSNLIELGLWKTEWQVANSANSPE